MPNDREMQNITTQMVKKLFFTLKFKIFDSKYAKITPNNLKMAYFDLFRPIFEPVTYEFDVFLWQMTVKS